MGILALIVAVGMFFYLTNELKKQSSQLKELKDQLARLQNTDAPGSAKDRSTPAPTVAKQPAKTDRPPKPATLANTSPSVSQKPAAAVATPDATPSSFVFREENLLKFSSWLKENWFYAIAALCLALAGVFLVQYGAENGLLTPFWRVMGALALGLALIGAGEWVRRKSGDDAGSSTAFLPSTFSGAGLIALFAGVLAARQLYGLIGAETAFAGLVAVSLIAVLLGWFYGPLLAIVGVLGATLAPFMVGGSGGSPNLYYYYFAIIAATALLIDTVRRWAWPSVFALIFTFGATVYVFFLAGGDQHFLAFALIVLIASVTIPVRKLWPDHKGQMVLASFLAYPDKTNGTPEFPTRIAFGAFIAASAAIFIVAMQDSGEAEILLTLFATAILFVFAVVWFRNAPALSELAGVAPVLFLIILAHQGATNGALYSAFLTAADQSTEISTGFKDDDAPLTILMLVSTAAIGSAMAFFRGLKAQLYGLHWAAGAALIAPVTIVLLEVFWMPVNILGAGRWSAYALGIAALMTFFAERTARVDGQNHRRAAIFAVAAMTMISFALILMLSQTALTVALAVMVLLAILVDRKFDLRLLSVFAQIGVIVVGWRLVLDPGFLWAIDAPLPDVIFGYAGVIALFALAWYMLKKRARHGTSVVIESAIWSLTAVFFTVLIFQFFENDLEEFWAISLISLVWLISAGNQFYRLKAGGELIWTVRLVLGCIFSLIGMLGLFLVTTALNPLLGWGARIDGPIIFDTLLIAYGLPALVFGVLAWKLEHAYKWARIALICLSAFYTALYAALEIRRLWRGDNLSVYGTTDPELYTYTVAMLVASVALLFFAFSKRSHVLYKVAIVGVGLTIAKVFLVDMGGLSGLIRVASFLGLGLSLAGLAWINGKMKSQWHTENNDTPAA